MGVGSHWMRHASHPCAVFTLVTRGLYLTSASKFNIDPNDEFFDANPQNDCASPRVKTPTGLTLSEKHWTLHPQTNDDAAH